MTTEHTWCAAWDSMKKRIVISPIEDIVNINAAAMMDSLPGLAVVRFNMTEKQAATYAAAFSNTRG